MPYKQHWERVQHNSTLLLSGAFLGETHVRLHADNCVGQNINNTMLHYLIWRVMVGLHKENCHVILDEFAEANISQLVGSHTVEVVECTIGQLCFLLGIRKKT